KRDKPIQDVVAKIFKHQTPEGPFQIIINLPKVFDGTGKDELSWMFCDAVVVVYALVKFGYGKNPQVKKAVNYLTSLVRDNGWPCKADPVFGPNFKGPGRREDPCPYVNFYMVKVLAQLPEWHKSKEMRTGIDTIFTLWRSRKKRKPYLFGMGTDFKKLKVQFVWYHILHLLFALHKLPAARKRKEYKQLVKIVQQKVDKGGKFTPESVYRVHKDWDFGQKREPSEWLTLNVYRVLAA
ncbi:MAG: hypothetical protein ACE5DX_04470, partial [Candidatus Dojkabacteria bacterium]